MGLPELKQKQHTLFILLCIGVWGNTYRSYLQPLFILQKRSIRIIHKVGYNEHNNPLFIKAKLIKYFDSVKFQIMQFMYKARYHSLPINVIQMFYERDGKYNLRNDLNFKF